MSAHTPGPWKVIRRLGSHTLAHTIVGGNGEHVANLDRAQGMTAQEANARLITAAPDHHTLLVGIEMALDEWDHWDDEERAEWVRLVKPQIRAAIAKAEGGGK